MPSSPAPFVSFNDYLDANAGSLQQERGQLLGGAQGAVSKAQADLAPMGDAAYQAGQDEAKADWTQQRQAGGLTSSAQYKPGTYQNLDAGQMAKIPGFTDFTKDREAASQAVNTAQVGGLGSGKTAFEAGMLGADTGYRDQAAAVSKQYNDSVNNYLDTLNKRGAEGYGAFAPAPVVGHQVVVDKTQNVPGVTNAGAPGQGPVVKPTHHVQKTINGVPVAGEDELP